MKIKLDSGAIAPTRAHDTDAGLDLYSPIEINIPSGWSRYINTGVHIQLPHGTAGLIVSKSGLNVMHGITSTGLIDEGYTGAIRVRLYNKSPEDYQIHIGDKISQSAESAITVYTIIEPAVLAPENTEDTRLKLKIPNKPQFTAPTITKI